MHDARTRDLFLLLPGSIAKRLSRGALTSPVCSSLSVWRGQQLRPTHSRDVTLRAHHCNCCVVHLDQD